MNKIYKYINAAPLARDAGVGVRSLQMAIKEYVETEGQNITPPLVQANQFLASVGDNETPYDELATEQMQSYLKDLQRIGKHWTVGHILSVALLHFWHSKEIVRCLKCGSAIAYPPEIPILEGAAKDNCSRCGTEVEYEI